LRKDHTMAFELLTRAADLEYAPACHNIGYAYDYGDGVDKDEKKALHYYELAAMQGSVFARYSLSGLEKKRGNIGRAIKHYVVAVGGGDKYSLVQIQQLYSNGQATKEVYTKALRAYQIYLNEVKSPQRDEAAVYSDEYKYL